MYTLKLTTQYESEPPRTQNIDRNWFNKTLAQKALKVMVKDIKLGRFSSLLLTDEGFWEIIPNEIPPFSKVKSIEVVRLPDEEDYHEF